jgi:hypothetical protein
LPEAPFALAALAFLAPSINNEVASAGESG